MGWREGEASSPLVIPSLTKGIGESKTCPVYLDAILLHDEQQHQIQAMIDSGATGNFVDKDLIESLHIPTQLKGRPEAVQAVDGKPLSSGPITEHTVAVQMICKTEARSHQETIRFNVIAAPQYGFILGMPWLVSHAPVIDWDLKKVSFVSPKCRDHFSSEGQSPVLALGNGCNIATAAEVEIDLPREYRKYLDVFSKDQAEVLPPHREYDCQIDLVPEAILPCCRVYALSERETQYLREYLDHYESLGFIRPSKSPAASPIFFIPKANKDLRACVDYRILNKYTVRNRILSLSFQCC